jgi:PKD repeat protein
VTDPSIRAVGAAGIGNAATTTHVVPATAVVGDLLVLVVVGGGFTFTDPPGWVYQSQRITPTTTSQLSTWVWTKRCVAGDPGATVSVTSAGINRKIGVILAVQDAGASGGVDVTSSIAYETAATSRTAASATTTAGSLPILIATDRASSTVAASSTWTWPAGYTGVFAGRGSANVNTGDVSLGIATGPMAAQFTNAGGGNYVAESSLSKSVSTLITIRAVQSYTGLNFHSIRDNDWTARLDAADTTVRTIANATHSGWLGPFASTPANQVSGYVTAAAGKTFACTLYAIPNRDTGGYSAGGFPDRASYLSWITSARTGSGSAPVWWILEPDALGKTVDMTTTAAAERQETLRQAVVILKQNPNAKVFIDLSHWISAAQAVTILGPAGISVADGFAGNVSNFQKLSTLHAWAESVLTALAANGTTGKKYILDTGRNGNGPVPVSYPGSDIWHSTSQTWCNPPGRGAGFTARKPDAYANCLAYLWIKSIGGSDGPFPTAAQQPIYTTNAPASGDWWQQWVDKFVADTDTYNLVPPTPPAAPPPNPEQQGTTAPNVALGRPGTLIDIYAGAGKWTRTRMVGVGAPDGEIVPVEYWVGTGSTGPLDPPTAALTVTPATGTAPLAVTANVSGSSEPQGYDLTYSINWGDGSAAVDLVGAAVTATHTYTATGSYTATLTATSTTGLVDTDVKSIAVGVTAPLPRLQVTPLTGAPPLLVTATHTNSTDPSGGTLDYQYAWGDGTANTAYTTAASVTHTYAAAGTYRVVMTARSSNGGTATTGQTVTVATVVAKKMEIGFSGGPLALGGTNLARATKALGAPVTFAGPLYTGTDVVEPKATRGPFYGGVPASWTNTQARMIANPDMATGYARVYVSFQTIDANLTSYARSAPAGTRFIFKHEAELMLKGYTLGADYLTDYRRARNAVKNANPNVEFGMASASYPYRAGGPADVAAGNWLPAATECDFYGVDVYQGSDANPTLASANVAQPLSSQVKFQNWYKQMLIKNPKGPNQVPWGLTEYGVHFIMYWPDPNPTPAIDLDRAKTITADYAYLKQQGASFWLYWYYTHDYNGNYPVSREFVDQDSLEAWRTVVRENASWTL